MSMCTSDGASVIIINLHMHASIVDRRFIKSIREAKHVQPTLTSASAVARYAGTLNSAFPRHAARAALLTRHGIANTVYKNAECN